MTLPETRPTATRVADTMRATVFHGETRVQGFGTDASKYAGEIVDYRGDKRLLLTYSGLAPHDHKPDSDHYDPRMSFIPSAPKR